MAKNKKNKKKNQAKKKSYYNQKNSYNYNNKNNKNVLKQKRERIAMINFSLMRKICTSKNDDFEKFIEKKYQAKVDDNENIFIDNNADILAVGHRDNYGTDYGGNSKHFYMIGDRLYNASLDDRAGIYAILDLFPKLGINADVLITDDEEIGQSTAMYFNTEKKYKWIVEFDRAGTDVVLYQYEGNKNWADEIAKIFRKVGYGSFSDISMLDDLGICAVNVGTGYYDAHTEYSYLDIDDFMTNIYLFKAFYELHKNTIFEFAGYGYGKYDKYSYFDNDMVDHYGRNYNYLLNAGTDAKDDKAFLDEKWDYCIVCGFDDYSVIDGYCPSCLDKIENGGYQWWLDEEEIEEQIIKNKRKNNNSNELLDSDTEEFPF